MFENVGSKIKGLAKFVCYFGIALSVLSGLLIVIIFSSLNPDFSGAAVLIALVVVGIGWLFSWILNLLLYGYGELVENTTILVESNKDAKNIKKIIESKRNAVEEEISNNNYNANFRKFIKYQPTDELEYMRMELRDEYTADELIMIDQELERRS